MSARWSYLWSLSLGTVVGLSGCHSCGSCGKKTCCPPPPGARPGAPAPLIASPPPGYPGPPAMQGSVPPTPAFPATPAPGAPAFAPNAPPPVGAQRFYGPVTSVPPTPAPAAASDGWSPVERPDIRLAPPESNQSAPQGSGPKEFVPTAVAALTDHP